MDSAGFDPTRWNHWLLIGCFISVSIWGLYLSWQWSAEARLKRKRAKLARRLAIALHSVRPSSAPSSAADGRSRSPSTGRWPQNTLVNEEFTTSRSIKK